MYEFEESIDEGKVLKASYLSPEKSGCAAHKTLVIHKSGGNMHRKESLHLPFYFTMIKNSCDKHIPGILLSLNKELLKPIETSGNTGIICLIYVLFYIVIS